MHDPPSRVLIGGPEKRRLTIEPYDPAWPAKFHLHRDRLLDVLGSRALSIEHIGSTAVPGLAAKPIVDIMLEVQDASDESAYLPHLENAGYVLRVREPEWHEHRMFRTPDLGVHVHVYSEECREIERLLRFRERLRANEADRSRYESTKRDLAEREWADMNEYAQAKTEVIEAILAATF